MKPNVKDEAYNDLKKACIRLRSLVSAFLKVNSAVSERIVYSKNVEGFEIIVSKKICFPHWNPEFSVDNIQVEIDDGFLKPEISSTRLFSISRLKSFSEKKLLYFKKTQIISAAKSIEYFGCENAVEAVEECFDTIDEEISKLDEKRREDLSGNPFLLI